MLLNSNQFVQCVLLSQEEEELLRGDAAQKGYRFFAGNLADIRTSGDLMRRTAETLSFPSYFGGNWDAFFDMVTDLSWNPAPGYVVLLKNAAALLHLPSEQLAIFARLCSAAAERWRSGKDEEGKAIPRTSFYFLFEGEASFCRLITDLLTNGNP